LFESFGDGVCGGFCRVECCELDVDVFEDRVDVGFPFCREEGYEGGLYSAIRRRRCRDDGRTIGTALDLRGDGL
jgi:hypothetical protein